MTKVEFSLQTRTAKKPAKVKDAYTLYASAKTNIKPSGTLLVETGVKITIPKGHIAVFSSTDQMVDNTMLRCSQPILQAGTHELNIRIDNLTHSYSGNTASASAFLPATTRVVLKNQRNVYYSIDVGYPLAKMYIVPVASDLEHNVIPFKKPQ